jgi:hypothetical protein
MVPTPNRQSRPHVSGQYGDDVTDRRTIADYHIVSATQITPQLVQQHLDETRDFELLLAQITNTSPPLPLP